MRRLEPLLRAWAPWDLADPAHQVRLRRGQAEDLELDVRAQPVQGVGQRDDPVKTEILGKLEDYEVSLLR